MRNYDWGFAPNPRRGYFAQMWPVDREATFGFGGTGAHEPSGGYGGGARYRGFYDEGYAARGYDARMRQAAPRSGGAREMYVRPSRGGYDRVHFRGGYGGPRGEYGGAYPGFGGYPGRGEGMYTGWDEGREVGSGFRGGRGAGYDRGYDRGGYGGYGRGGWERGAGGGRGFADAPFVPEEAYRRHPEMEARPHHQDAVYGAPDDVGRELDDGDVYQSIRQRIHQDRYLDAGRIDVMVNDGVVTLEGEVDDFMEARYAWDDAWETPGVRGVVNNLTVRTDVPSVSHNDEMPQSAGGDANA